MAKYTKQSPCQVLNLILPIVYAEKYVAESMPRENIAGLLGKNCQVQARIAHQKRAILCKLCKAKGLREITADSMPRLERIGEKGEYRYIAV